MRIAPSDIMLYAHRMNTPNGETHSWLDLMPKLIRKLYGWEFTVGVELGWGDFMNAKCAALQKEIPPDRVVCQPRSENIEKALLDVYESEFMVLAHKRATQRAEQRLIDKKAALRNELERELGFDDVKGSYFEDAHILVVRREPGPQSHKKERPLRQRRYQGNTGRKASD